LFDRLFFGDVYTLLTVAHFIRIFSSSWARTDSRR